MSYLGNPNYLDNAVLFSGTIAAVGPGISINTTGYNQTIWQLSSSTFSGIITVEISIDGVYWTPSLIVEISSLLQKTQIDSQGLYLVKADTTYVRYNIQNIVGSANLIIVGSLDTSTNPVDRIAWATEDSNNTPINVKFQPGSTKQDPG